MNGDLRVATPPARPLLVFDGDCHFCGLWIRRWRQLTADAVDYLPAQDPGIAAQFPEIPGAQFAEAVVFIETDGAVYAGAEAVFRALAYNPRWQWPSRFYDTWPLFAGFTGRAYRFVAAHRPGFSRLTRWLWGRHVESLSYNVARWLFLRALGAVYLVAFLSLGSQAGGLIGHNGILPVDQYMPAVGNYCDAHGIGPDRYHQWPTLCWFDTSDAFLHFQCSAGVILAVLLILDFAPVVCLFLVWLLYLSLVVVDRDFLGFQWDNLLLEAGFLAVFLAPLRLLPKWIKDATSPRPSPPFGMAEREKTLAASGFERSDSADATRGSESPPSRLVVWLLRLLLFKLMFSSGCVKLLSGDPTWRNLTALTFHYQTQPLPTWIAWYAQQLPEWFQKASCAAMFGIELGAPFLILAPRRPRFLGAALLAGLQVLILLTGNYTFFNVLTLALCLLLLDDFALGRLVPNRRRSFFSLDPEHRSRPAGGETADHSPSPGREGRGEGGRALYPEGPKSFHWPRPVLVLVAVIWLSASSFIMVETMGLSASWLAPCHWMAGELGPLRSVNNYGLFAVMTTQRNEIVIEGSNDGVRWLSYEFKYKPGDVKRPPAFVAPFQPRLDWQMWFAALGSAEQNPWFVGFCERLLQGSPEVLALLSANPFPDHPPRLIRAEFYNYRFSTFAERRATGDWWQRTLTGEYLPPVSLRE